MKNAFAVIMAGGKGERFWPLSTSATPKKTLSLVGGEPLIAMAVDRLKGLIRPENILIVTTEDIVGQIRKSVKSIPPSNVVGEPVGRDTAAAIALASSLVRRHSPAGVFAVLTADHLISPRRAFQKTLRGCLQVAAREDVLITIGVTPDHPATGYGYIEVGRPVSGTSSVELLKTVRFVEKPDLKTAKKYLATGKYFWNSGMFVWSVDAIQNALMRHRPQLQEMARRIEPLIGTSKFRSALAREYAALEKISIDYAVMEKSRNILMAKCKFDWDDVGTWTALENHFDRDANGNVRMGRCESIDSSGNIVVSGDRLTGLIGVKDLVVVQAKGATLICPKSRAEDVKKLVRLLREVGTYQELL
ncbi:MAG: sugar phosphate nucleotidyltransferase [bacterium]